MRILILDLSSTAPAYTAYFANSLDTDSTTVHIAGIQKVNTYKDIEHLQCKYLNWMDVSERTKNPLVKKILKIIEYLINWLMVLSISKKYDVVHIQWLQLLKFSSLELFFVYMLKQLNSNVFYTVHNIYPHDNTSETVKKRYQKVYKTVKGLIVHTDKTRHVLVNELSLSENKILTMPHGPMFHDIPVKYEVEIDEKMFGILGYIRPYKGVEDAIEAVKLTNEKGYDFKLIIAGKAEEEYGARLSNMVREYNLVNNVILHFDFLDNCEFIATLKKVKASIFPYRKIDQSGAAITSLSVGTPVVGYDIGGLSELIKNRYNGILVKKDDILSLANSMIEISKISREILKKNCIESIYNISWEKSSCLVREFYSNMI